MRSVACSIAGFSPPAFCHLCWKPSLINSISFKWARLKIFECKNARDISLTFHGLQNRTLSDHDCPSLFLEISRTKNGKGDTFLSLQRFWENYKLSPVLLLSPFATILLFISRGANWVREKQLALQIINILWRLQLGHTLIFFSERNIEFQS